MREINPTRGVRKAPGKIQPRRTPHAQAVRLIREYQANPNPPMKRPGIRAVVHGGQSILEHLGLGGAAHPIRRVQNIPKGGPMVFPVGGFKPKLPGFMVEPITKAKGLKSGQMDMIKSIDREGGQTFFDRAHPRLPSNHPIRLERHVFGYGPPGGNFLDHLARLNDPVANKHFVNWMMKHHYRRPN